MKGEVLINALGLIIITSLVVSAFGTLYDNPSITAFASYFVPDQGSEPGILGGDSQPPQFGPAVDITNCRNITSSDSGDYFNIISNITGTQNWWIEGTDRACIFINKSNIVVSCEIVSLDPEGNNTTAGFKGVSNGDSYAIWIENANNVTVEKCIMENFTTGYVRLKNANGSATRDNVFVYGNPQSSSFNAVWGSDGSWSYVIDNNTFLPGFPSSGLTRTNGNNAGSSAVNITNNRLQNNSITIWYDNNIVRNNTCEGIGCFIEVGLSADDNAIYQNNYSGSSLLNCIRINPGSTNINNDVYENIINCSGGTAYGIYVTRARNAIHSNNVTGCGVGIYLTNTSNNITNNILYNNTIDFQATNSGNYTNTRIDSTLLNVIWSGSIQSSGVSVPVADPSGFVNVDKYVNITGPTWALVNISYNQSIVDARGIFESSLQLFKNNGTWYPASDFASSYGVDTTNNYVYANITSFSTFAPMGTSTNVTNCMNITSSGEYTLVNNLTNVQSGWNRCIYINASNVTLDCGGNGNNITLDSYASDRTAIYVNNSTNVSVRNCYIYNYTSSEILYNESAFGNISDNYIQTNSSQSIYLSAGSNFTVIENNSIINYNNWPDKNPSQYSGTGIALYISSNVTISNNSINHTGGSISVGTYSDNSTVSDNVLYDNYIGITGRLSAYGLVEDNTVTNTYAFGIDFYDCHNFTVNGNTLLNASNDYDISVAGSAFINDHVFNDVILNDTTVSFTSGGNVSLRYLPTYISDPLGFENVSEYVNVTNHGSGLSWMLLNVSYNETYVETDLGLDEDDLIMFKNNGTWYNASDFSSQYGVDTANDYVWANITNFSIFAPMGPLSEIPVMNCMNLTTADSVYTLSNDLSGNQTRSSGLRPCIDVQANNVTLDCDGYNLTGTFVNTGANTVGIMNSDYNNTNIMNCEIYNYSYGIDISGSTNGSINDSYIEHSTVEAKSGVRLRLSTTGYIIDNNEIVKTRVYGIYLESSSGNNTITNNIIRNNSVGYGILINGPSYNLVNNTTIYWNERGILIFSAASYNNITYSNLYNNTHSGLTLDDAANNNIIEDNVITYNQYYGIFQDGTLNNTFIDNNVSFNTEWDFYSAGSSGDIIDHMMFNDTNASFTFDGQIGVRDSQTEPSDTSQFSNVTEYLNITGDTWALVNVSYDQSVVTSYGLDENYLVLAKNDGIWKAPSGYASQSGINTANDYVWANITDFSIFAPMELDVTQISNCANLSISDTVYNLTTNLIGVQLDWDRCIYIDASNVTLDCGGQSNNITAGLLDSYGIYVDQADDVTIRNCHVYDYQDTGIFAIQSDDILITENTVDNNIYGVKVQNSDNVYVEDNEIIFNGDYGLYIESTSTSDNVTVVNNNISYSGQTSGPYPPVPGPTGLFMSKYSSGITGMAIGNWMIPSAICYYEPMCCEEGGYTYGDECYIDEFCTETCEEPLACEMHDNCYDCMAEGSCLWYAEDMGGEPPAPSAEYIYHCEDFGGATCDEAGYPCDEEWPACWDSTYYWDPELGCYEEDFCSGESGCFLAHDWAGFGEGGYLECLSEVDCLEGQCDSDACFACFDVGIPEACDECQFTLYDECAGNPCPYEGESCFDAFDWIGEGEDGYGECVDWGCGGEACNSDACFACFASADEGACDECNSELSMTCEGSCYYEAPVEECIIDDDCNEGYYCGSEYTCVVDARIIDVNSFEVDVLGLGNDYGIWVGGNLQSQFYSAYDAFISDDVGSQIYLQIHSDDVLGDTSWDLSGLSVEVETTSNSYTIFIDGFNHDGGTYLKDVFVPVGGAPYAFCCPDALIASDVFQGCVNEFTTTTVVDVGGTEYYVCEDMINSGGGVPLAAGDGNGVRIINAYNLTIQNNTLHYNDQNGIILQNVTDSVIDSTNITESGEIGFYITESSDNVISDMIIIGSDYLDYYSSSSDNITVIDIIFNYTTVSFTYDGTLTVDSPSSVPTDPVGYSNVTEYLNITGDTWALVNVSYNETYVETDLGLDEDDLIMFKNNGTWYNASDFSSQYGVDTANDYVWANITNFSIFAPMGEVPVEPYWYNEFVTPSSPTTYSSGASYEFNISWDDPNTIGKFDNATFETNISGSLTNYTILTSPATSNSSDEWTITFTDLPTGVYQYKWYGIDETDLENSTSVLYYIVNQAPVDIALYLDGTRGDISHMVNTTANFTAVSNVTGRTVNITTNITGWGADKTGVTNVTNITNMTVVGLYNITAYTEGDINYSSDSETHYIEVTEGNDLEILNITYDPIPVYLNTRTNFTVNVTNNGPSNATNITMAFYFNDSFHSSTDSINLAAGEWHLFYVTTTFSRTGVHRFNASVTSDQNDINETNNNESVTFSVIRKPGSSGPEPRPKPKPPLVQVTVPRNFRHWPKYLLPFLNCSLIDQAVYLSSEGATILLEGSIDENGVPAPQSAAVLLYGEGEVLENETNITTFDAYVRSIQCIAPEEYAILACNETVIASYEIDVDSDHTLFCYNYEGASVRPESITVSKFFNGEWVPITLTNIIRDEESNVICADITGETPYIISGYAPIAIADSAWNTIQLAEKSIEDLKAAGEDTSVQEGILQEAKEAYAICDYQKVIDLANQLITPPFERPIVIWLLILIPVLAGVYYNFYGKLQRKKPVKAHVEEHEMDSEHEEPKRKKK